MIIKRSVLSMLRTATVKVGRFDLEAVKARRLAVERPNRLRLAVASFGQLWLAMASWTWVRLACWTRLQAAGRRQQQLDIAPVVRKGTSGVVSKSNSLTMVSRVVGFPATVKTASRRPVLDKKWRREGKKVETWAMVAHRQWRRNFGEVVLLFPSKVQWRRRLGFVDAIVVLA